MSLRGLQQLSRLAAGAAIRGTEPAAAACSVSSFTSFASSSRDVDHMSGCACNACAAGSRPSPSTSPFPDRDQACGLALLGYQHVQRRSNVAAIRRIRQLSSSPHSLQQQQHFCMSTSAHPAQPSSGQSTGSSAASSSSDPGSSAPEDPGKEKRPPLSEDVYYEGPLSKTHKMLKLVSISNTVIACAAAPLIVMYADISYVSRVGLASSMVIFGLLTTGALHWITNPYVHELKFNAATQQIDVRTVTLLGGHRWHSFHLSDVKPLPWDRPVATFVANNRFYYIDVYSFPDEELLKRLTPDEASVPKGYKDDEDD